MASALEQFVNSVRQLSAQGEAWAAGLGRYALAPVRMLGPPLALASPGPVQALVLRVERTAVRSTARAVGRRSPYLGLSLSRALETFPSPPPSPPPIPHPLSGPSHGAPLDSLGA